MTKKLSSMRQSYELSALDRGELNDDPMIQFAEWLGQAVDHEDVGEANAMVLSTVSQDLQPSSRVLLLKEVSSDFGLVFYTNYNSRKGQELAYNEKVAANFWWPPLQRQVRIEGHVSKVTAEMSDQYFNSRPTGSQLGAIASAQSQPLTDRSALENVLARLEKSDPKSLARPQHWGGYGIKPTYFEFWQGRANRLHDRFAYQLKDGSWSITRLAP